MSILSAYFLNGVKGSAGTSLNDDIIMTSAPQRVDNVYLASAICVIASKISPALDFILVVALLAKTDDNGGFVTKNRYHDINLGTIYTHQRDPW